MYEYTTVDHWHPNPAYRPRGTLAVNVRVAGVELFAANADLADSGREAEE